jgi:hypothetical protein
MGGWFGLTTVARPPQTPAAAQQSRKTASEAAQESNLPTDGLHRPAGFEDRMGHRARAAPRRQVYVPAAAANGDTSGNGMIDHLVSAASGDTVYLIDGRS